MWKSAKLASGVKAPIRTLTPSAASVSRTGAGCSSRLSNCALVLGRDHDAQPREQRHDVDREGDEERIAPAPVEEVRVATALVIR